MDRAVRMVEQLLGEFEHSVESFTLIPSRGGAFEVVVDDRIIFSKKAEGRHAEYEEVAAQLRG